MPSKRSHGEGTLRHRSDGRWELRMMDGYQKDGSPRFKTFYGKTQKEVKLKLKEYQDALISGVQLDTILYFEDWADTWFEGHKDNIAPTTQESYKYCLKMLKEGFYHRPLTVIRPIDIENFLKGMDIQTIQSIVGHADTEMTEHYLHVQESIRQSAIQLFSEAFSA